MKPTPPKTVGVAVQLIGLALVTALVIYLTYYLGFKLVARPTTHLEDTTGFDMVLDAVQYYIIMILCICFIYQGQNWARLLGVFYPSFRVIMHLLSNTTTTLDIMQTMLILTYIGILIIAFTLLFTPESNAWFRGTTAATPPSTARPKSMSVGIYTLSASLLLFILINALAFAFYRHPHVDAGQLRLPIDSSLALLIDTPINLIIMVPALLAVYYRKNWGRIVIIVYICVRILYHFYTVPLLPYAYSFELLIYLFLILNIIGATLLFCPESNRWFSLCPKQK